MTRHYTTRDFFRQMPNALLSRYFGSRGVLNDVDFSGLSEARPDRLFAVWLELPDDRRHEMDAEFREIFELSNEKGFQAIIDEAEWHLATNPEGFSGFVDKLSALPNHFERAMVAFLDHKEYWKGATRFYHADTLTHWRKRKNLPHVSAAVDDDSLRELSDMICDYFHRVEGRGKNCVVEPFRRGDLDYFFAYPEDYSQNSVEWVEGEFDRRPHNPAFEVVYVYSQEDGTLDLNIQGSYKAVAPLQQLFATAILKLQQLPPDSKDGRIYNLNPLRERGFEFVFDAATGIRAVAVKKLRFSSNIAKGDRITLEADVTRNPKAIYDLVDQMRDAVPLHLYNVTQVELTVSMVTDEDKPPKAVRVSVTYPNSCSLKYDDIGLKLRAMLHASGIEPHESTQGHEGVNALP